MNIEKIITTALKIFAKVVGGLIILPLSAFVYEIWPWFEEASGSKKWMSAIVIIPVVALLWVAAPLWDDLEVG